MVVCQSSIAPLEPPLYSDPFSVFSSLLPCVESWWVSTPKLLNHHLMDACIRGQTHYA
jgi:hypothetical protein